MEEKQETRADIIREMRDLGALDEQCGDMIPRSLQALGLRTYAARLEAAAERERAEAATARTADLDALERACEEVLDGETLKAVMQVKRRIMKEAKHADA